MPSFFSNLIKLLYGGIHRMWLLYLIIIAAVLLDRISKILIVGNMVVYESFPVIDGVLNFTYVKNTGAAFSMLSSGNMFFAVLSAVVIIGALVFLHYKKYKNKFMLAYAGMIIGGAAGNLFDRIYYKYVIDFIDVQFVKFAVFNIADCFIVVGCILLAAWIMLYDSKSKKEVSHSEDD